MINCYADSLLSYIWICSLKQEEDRELNSVLFLFLLWCYKIFTFSVKQSKLQLIFFICIFIGFTVFLSESVSVAESNSLLIFVSVYNFSSSYVSIESIKTTIILFFFKLECTFCKFIQFSISLIYIALYYMYKHSCMYVYVEFLFIKAILVYLIYFVEITVEQFCVKYIYIYICI